MTSLESIGKLRDCTWIGGGKVNEYLDEIEREIAERFIELPVDADGVPIHVGDVLEYDYGDDVRGTRMVCALIYDGTRTKESDGGIWDFEFDDDDGDSRNVGYMGDFYESNRHVKPRTVEDVLEEFLHASADVCAEANCELEEQIAKYADELRELLGGDGAMSGNRTTERIDHPPRVREAIDELMREKDATGNRTTELPMEHFRAALEKRGIEYETNDDECAYGEPRCTVFKAHIGGDRETDIVIVGVKDWYFDGKLTPWLDVEFHNVLTPEQAIAATLESEREKALEELVRSLYADYYDEWPDRAEKAYTERMKELGIEVIDE